MKWIALPLILLCLSVSAAIDTFEFKSSDKRELFQELSEELRCPKCQNQNLADSNSAIAQDLRNELYRMVVDGNNTIQIKEFMVERYGQFVLYKPQVNSLTYVLWYGPFVLLGLGLIVVVTLAKSKRTNKPVKSDIAQTHNLNDEDQKKLAALLANKTNNTSTNNVDVDKK